MDSNALTIKQTAELYGLSTDTLRYYEEIGLVIPGRNPSNGYRQYRTRDFAQLNMVISLQTMDFTLAQIREFFDDHSLRKSLQLIELEADALSAQIDVLSQKRKKVESCLLGLAKAMHEAPDERIFVASYPDRPYLMVAPTPLNPNDIPFVVARKARELGFAIDAFHTTPCFLLDTSSLTEEGEFTSSSILMYSAAPDLETDTFFPAGEYVSVTFSGGVKKTPEMYRRLCAFMEGNGLVPEGDPIEFWLVHEYISDDPGEYIQTLEQKVVAR